MITGDLKDSLELSPQYWLAWHLVVYLHLMGTYLGWFLSSSQHQKDGVKRIGHSGPSRTAEWGKAICTPALSPVRILGDLSFASWVLRFHADTITPDWSISWQVYWGWSPGKSICSAIKLLREMCAFSRNSSNLSCFQPHRGESTVLLVSRSLALAQSVALLPFWPLLFCWILLQPLRSQCLFLVELSLSPPPPILL